MTPRERAERALEGRLASIATSVTRERIAREIREAVAEEREACALLAYEYPAPDPGGSWRESIGAAIRARKAP